MVVGVVITVVVPIMVKALVVATAAVVVIGVVMVEAVGRGLGKVPVVVKDLVGAGGVIDVFINMVNPVGIILEFARSVPRCVYVLYDGAVDLLKDA